MSQTEAVESSTARGNLFSRRQERQLIRAKSQHERETKSIAVGAAIDAWFKIPAEQRVHQRVRAFCSEHHIMKERNTFMRRIEEIEVGNDVHKALKTGSATPLLPDKEEAMLAVTVAVHQAMGYTLKPKEIRRRAGITADILARGKARHVQGVLTPTNKPSSDWWKGFIGRRTYLTVRRSSSLHRHRGQNANAHIVSRYFALLKALLEAFQFVSIYNMDETFVQLDQKGGSWVCGLKGSYNCYTPGASDREHITIIECVSNHGRALRPTAIFKGTGKTFNAELLHGFPTKSRVGVSPKGWTSDLIFEQWMCFFLEETSEERARGKVLLILDGHNSHRYYDALRLAKDSNVEVLCLPAHLTHLAQPLDKSIFASVKNAFRDTVEKAVGQRTLSRYDVGELYTAAREKGLTPGAIKTGFQRTGIHPFNPAALLDSGELSTSIPTSYQHGAEVTLPLINKKHLSKLQADVELSGLRVRLPSLGRMIDCLRQADQHAPSGDDSDTQDTHDQLPAPTASNLSPEAKVPTVQPSPSAHNSSQPSAPPSTIEPVPSVAPMAVAAQPLAPAIAQSSSESSAELGNPQPEQTAGGARPVVPPSLVALRDLLQAMQQGPHTAHADHVAKLQSAIKMLEQETLLAGPLSTPSVPSERKRKVRGEHLVYSNSSKAVLFTEDTVMEAQRKQEEEKKKKAGEKKSKQEQKRQAQSAAQSAAPPTEHTAGQAAPTTRKRGRPPANSTQPVQASASSSTQSSASALPAKRAARGGAGRALASSATSNRPSDAEGATPTDDGPPKQRQKLTTPQPQQNSSPVVFIASVGPAGGAGTQAAFVLPAPFGPLSLSAQGPFPAFRAGQSPATAAN